MDESYREIYARRMQEMMAALPGGTAGFIELARRPGYAVGMGLAAMAGASEANRRQHVDDLVSLAGQAGQVTEGDNDEAAGAVFLENIRAALRAGDALALEPEVLGQLEKRAHERGTTLMGLLGSMMNTFRLAEKGLTRI